MKTQIVLRSTGSGSVLVDGHDLSNAVKAVHVEACPGDEDHRQRLLVTLDLLGDVYATPDVEQLRLGEELQDALLRLGWTPPGPAADVTT